MKKINRIFLSILFPFCLLFSSPLPEDKVEFFEKTFDMDPTQPAHLEFHDVDGNLSFSPSGDNTLRLQVKKEIRGRWNRKAERLLRQTKISVSQTGNKLTVRITYPKWKGIFFWLSDSRRIRVTSEITLPENSRLYAKLVDGSINGRGVKGIMDLRTVDGSIELTDIRGSIRADTVDGRIHLNRIEGDVQAETVDGNVRISGDIKSLRVDAVDGNIKVAVSPLSFMEKSWRIKTIDGDVEIFLPEDFSAELDLHSGDGRVTSDFPLHLGGVYSKRTITGRLNAGGPLLIVKTSDGHIALKRWKGPEVLFPDPNDDDSY
ncbi:MAG: DUF4097 family beta strand repeat-containing protein [Candidatus Aminicenantales bacterium]